MWHFGIWLSRHGGVGLMVGLDDLRGLLQAKTLWFYLCQNTSKNFYPPFCLIGSACNHNVFTSCLFQMWMSEEESDMRQVLFYAQSIPLYIVAFRTVFMKS